MSGYYALHDDCICNASYETNYQGDFNAHLHVPHKKCEGVTSQAAHSDPENNP